LTAAAERGAHGDSHVNDGRHARLAKCFQHRQDGELLGVVPRRLTPDHDAPGADLDAQLTDMPPGAPHDPPFDDLSELRPTSLNRGSHKHPSLPGPSRALGRVWSTGSQCRAARRTGGAAPSSANCRFPFKPQLKAPAGNATARPGWLAPAMTAVHNHSAGRPSARTDVAEQGRRLAARRGGIHRRCDGLSRLLPAPARPTVLLFQPCSKGPTAKAQNGRVRGADFQESSQRPAGSLPADYRLLTRLLGWKGLRAGRRTGERVERVSGSRCAGRSPRPAPPRLTRLCHFRVARN
jgi:hypothetical protein